VPLSASLHLPAVQSSCRQPGSRLRPRAARAVAYGVLRAEALPAALQLASGAVQPVARSADGELFIGTARLTAANIPAANGVVHVLDGVLAGDMAVNTSVIGVAERLGDFGPFNASQARAARRRRQASRARGASAGCVLRPSSGRPDVLTPAAGHALSGRSSRRPSWAAPLCRAVQ